MRFIELDNGHNNKPTIDIDRVVSFQWFAIERNNPETSGKVTFRFFGSDQHMDVTCASMQTAQDMCESLRKITNTIPQKIAVNLAEICKT